MIEYILLTAANTPALSLDDVKEHLKIDDSNYDSQLFRLISSVTQFAEKITGRDLINKTYEAYLDKFPCDSIKIRKSKLQSINHIKYYYNGVLTTLSSSDYYFTKSNDYSTINLVDGKEWPSIDCRKQAIIITFVAGYGNDSCNIPALLKQAMLAHLTALFENAGDCTQDSNSFMDLYHPFIISELLVRIA